MTISGIRGIKSCTKKPHKVGQLLIVVIDDEIVKLLQLDADSLLQQTAMPDGSISIKKIRRGEVDRKEKEVVV
jgi:hypothetical protein